MKIENQMRELVLLQAVKIAEEFSIIDFAKMTIEAYEKNQFINEQAAQKFFEELNEKYAEFIVETAEERVKELFEKHAKRIIKQREGVE